MSLEQHHHSDWCLDLLSLGSGASRGVDRSSTKNPALPSTKGVGLSNCGSSKVAMWEMWRFRMNRADHL